jgi:hypothetical protein
MISLIQKKEKVMKKIYITIAVCALSMSVIISAGGSIAKPDRIEVRFTTVPPPGGGSDKMMTIAGVVEGIKAKECGCRIVLYAQTDKLYVQPWADAPFTELKADNSFETLVHLGNYYYAVVVSNTFQPGAILNEPPTVGGEILAVSRIEARPN